MKYSVDIEKYKEEIKALRKDLDLTLKTGHLDDGFKNKLVEVEACEEKILKELLPYYRLYNKNLYPTKISEQKLKFAGLYKIDSYIKNFLQVSDNIFLLGTIDGQVYFSRLLKTDPRTIELSQPIKNFSKLIVYLKKINQRQILALTVNGEIILISSNDFADVFENIKNLKITSFKKEIKAVEKVLRLDEKTFLCQLGPKNFAVLVFDFEKLTYKILEEISLPLEAEITSIYKISNNDLIFGTSKGDLVFGKFKDKKIYLEEQVKLSKEGIKEIKVLEDERFSNNTCGLVDAKGSLFLFDIKNKEQVKFEDKDLKGRLFNLSSRKETAIVLSEDGHVYVFEENLGKWTLNTKASLKERFFAGAWTLSPLTYLAVDIYGNFSLLNIDRLDSTCQLRNLSIFK